MGTRATRVIELRSIAGRTESLRYDHPSENMGEPLCKLLYERATGPEDDIERWNGATLSDPTAFVAFYSGGGDRVILIPADSDSVQAVFTNESVRKTGGPPAGGPPACLARR